MYCERGVARRLLAKFRGLPAFSARRVLRLRARRAFRNAAGLHGRWRTAGRGLQPDRAGLFAQRLSSASRVVLGHHVLQALARHVGVDGGGGNVRVPQEQLHDAQIGAVVEQMGGKGVTQGVG